MKNILSHQIQREKFKTKELTKISIFFHAFSILVSHDYFNDYNTILLISIFTLFIRIVSKEFEQFLQGFFPRLNRFLGGGNEKFGSHVKMEHFA